MGNYISEQLVLFLRSILLGGVLGLIYDLLRALRGLGGALWGGVLDALFCMGAFSAVFFFVLAGDGELRIFVLMGALGGAVLFFSLLSRPLRPVWSFWLQIFLSPLCFLWSLLQKGEQYGRKRLSFCRTWIIMKSRKRRAAPQEGDEQMADPKKQQRAKGKQKKKDRPKSKLTMVLLVVLFCGVCIQLYLMYGQLQRAKVEEAAYADYLMELQETNEKLKADIANSDDPELIQDIAREQLGLVFPDEKVFRYSS